MSEERAIEMKFVQVQEIKEPLPAIERPALPPAPPSPEQVRAIDAAFAPQQENNIAAGLLALWASGPMLADLLNAHLRKDKPEEEEREGSGPTE
jgi:hypothetical protein